MVETDKFNKFVAAITKEAYERQEAIENQVNMYIDEKLCKATNDSLLKMKRLYKHETAMIDEMMGQKLSQFELQNREELFNYRNKIKNEIYNLIKEKIINFTNSEEYPHFLQQSIKEVLLKIDDCNTNIKVYLREKDLSYKDIIKNEINQLYEFVVGNTILLGGIKIGTINKVFDNTLDARLNECFSWFYENSGLLVK